MQALAERVGDRFARHHVTAITPFQFAALKTVSPPPGDIVGQRLDATGRRGKFLVFDLEASRILIHLSQGGRVDLEAPAKSTRPRGAVARFVFGDAGAMLVKEYGTERKAAWWVLARDDPGPLTDLGPEPFDDAFAELVVTGDDRRRLHTMLRDQKTVAGVGRGYADDLLHAAQLSPFASLATLTPQQRTDLVDAARATLERALVDERKREGGLPAKLGDRFRIHRNHGKPCPRCGDALHRVSYESHEVVYCARCQTDGKVLADRRLSRLLK